MSQLLIKAVLSGFLPVRTSPPTRNLGFVRVPNVHLLRWFSSSSNQQSFTVSYLQNSLGFSSQSALSVSRYFNFHTPEKPDQVINFFKGRGFTKTQISRLVRGRPQVLLCNAEKTFLPKLEFFESKGISGPEIAKVVSVFPTILGSSLANQIVPSYNFLRNLFQSDKKLNVAIKRCPDILVPNIEKNVSPNINILREHGVPDSNIAKMMEHWPKPFRVSPDRFRKNVEKVKDIGFNASKINFVVAVYALSRSKLRWETKVGEYKKWGWSEEEVLKAFKRRPWCMTLSQSKLVACMDFFLNQMGWQPSLIAKYPGILSLSLKKRVVPRCLIFQALLSKGLVEKLDNLYALLLVSEERFLDKFVRTYKEESPELLKLYNEKLDLSERLEVDDKEKYIVE